MCYKYPQILAPLSTQQLLFNYTRTQKGWGFSMRRTDKQAESAPMITAPVFRACQETVWTSHLTPTQQHPELALIRAASGYTPPFSHPQKKVRELLTWLCVCVCGMHTHTHTQHTYTPRARESRLALR